MSILAGIFAHNPTISIESSTRERLRNLMSRQDGEEVSSFSDARIFLAKVDIGAYGKPAYRIAQSGTVTMISGEPLIDGADGTGNPDRAAGLEVLHKAWDADNWNILEKASGVFCAVHYDPQVPAVTLMVDKLGIRPIYYWLDNSYIIFASALRILEGLSEVSKIMDLRAVTEIVSFGYPLGTRTPYCGIRAPRAADIVRCSHTGTSTRQYWRWDRIPVSKRPEPELLKELHGAFIRAVKRRLRDDTVAVALLSGGLDSRCVVAALTALHARVLTFNFSFPGTQDQVLGAEFAARIGTLHHEYSVQIGNPETFERMARAWETSVHRKQWPPERPRMGWSGDGGSVGLGHVYMYPDVVELLRKRRVENAIERFLTIEKKHVLPRLFRPPVSAALSGTLHAGVREELKDIQCDDPGRGFYIFLLLNDQRRHLMAHFENIDRHRLEFHLPFFDSAVLEIIISAPLDQCLGHRLYNKWLSLFQPEVSRVPWQSYPGHEPSPVPVPPGLQSSWSAEHSTALRRSLKSDIIAQAENMLRDSQFPNPILNRFTLRLGQFLYRVGLRNYDYLLEAALKYHNYWSVCKGNYVIQNSLKPRIAEDS